MQAAKAVMIQKRNLLKLFGLLQSAMFLSRKMILNSGFKDYFKNASWISLHISSKTAHAGSRPETCH